MENIDQTWQDKKIRNLSSGLNVSKTGESIEDNQLTSCSNVIAYKDNVRSDTGYTPLGDSVIGTPRREYRFFKKDGTLFPILITNLRFYVWNFIVGQWQAVSDGAASTTLSGTESIGQVVIGVADRTGFNPNDPIAIIRADGTQHISTISSGYIATTGAGDITIDDALTVAAAASDEFITVASLSGSDDIQISLVSIPSDDLLIFTNGVDNLKVFDGDTCEDLAGIPASGDFQCRVVDLHEGHLLALNTTEAGVRYPQRVRNSDTFNFTEWSAGNAGFEDLYDTSDHITASLQLGPYRIIYRERSIVRQEYVGSEDILFLRDTMFIGDGTLAPEAVVDRKGSHIVFGNSGIYRYQGGFDIQYLSDKVWHKIFSSSGELSPSAKNRSFGLYVEELGEVWFLYPITAEEYPTRMVRYQESTNSWFVRDFLIPISGFGFFESRTVITWATATGTWIEATYPWNFSGLNSNAKITHLLSSTVNRVYEYNYISSLDDTEDIPWFMDTKDFSDPDYHVRVDSITVLARGNNVSVQYSIDQGSSWTSFNPISFSSSSLQEHTLHGQFVAERFRIRFSGTGSGFELSWIKFEVAKESGW